jgi:hypothetical protein
MNDLNRCLSCSANTTLITQQTQPLETFASNLSIAINTTVCAYTTANCKYYTIYGLCEICATNYVQRNRECLPIASNCDIPLSTDASKCSQCAIGYQLESSTQRCFAKIEGCTTYMPSGQCRACSERYLLRGGICFYQDFNCLEFKSNGNCLRCGNNLVPYYNRCVYYDAYCFLYDQNGICSKSMAGFSQNVQFNATMQQNYRAFIAFVRAIRVSSTSSASSGSAAELFYTANNAIESSTTVST